MVATDPVLAARPSLTLHGEVVMILARGGAVW